MDKLLKNKKILFTKQYYLKRISQNNRGKEVDWEYICDAKYNFNSCNANGLVIGVISHK